MMVAFRGRPIGHVSPYYVVASGQYVAVTWPVPSGTRVCQLFNAGYIDSLTRLSPAWQLVQAQGLGGEVVDWWRLPFPNHSSFGRGLRAAPVSTGFCPCSPGLQQPVGLPCDWCEEVVRADSPPVV